MNNIKIFSSVIVFLTLLFSSCDYVEKPLTLGNSIIDTGGLTVQRNVLLEEFTGHKCGPCPGGAKLARDLQAYYETQGRVFIIVSIHAGALAIPATAVDTFQTDFRTIHGDFIANSMFSSSLPYTPIGVINRVEYPVGVPWIDKPDWQAAADAQFALPVFADLAVSSMTFDTTTKAGSIDFTSTFLTTASGDYSLVVYLTQDSIVDWQVNGPSAVGDPAYPFNQDVPSYVHRHVFRGCLTADTYGVSIVTGGVVIDQQFSNTVAFDLDAMTFPANAPALDMKHLAIVAYIYDVASKEIVQVIDKHLE